MTRRPTSIDEAIHTGMSIGRTGTHAKYMIGAGLTGIIGSKIMDFAQTEAKQVGPVTRFFGKVFYEFLGLEKRAGITFTQIADQKQYDAIENMAHYGGIGLIMTGTAILGYNILRKYKAFKK